MKLLDENYRNSIGRVRGGVNRKAERVDWCPAAGLRAGAAFRSSTGMTVVSRCLGRGSSGSGNWRSWVAERAADVTRVWGGRCAVWGESPADVDLDDGRGPFMETHGFAQGASASRSQGACSHRAQERHHFVSSESSAERCGIDEPENGVHRRTLVRSGDGCRALCAEYVDPDVDV